MGSLTCDVGFTLATNRETFINALVGDKVGNRDANDIAPPVWGNVQGNH